jgi:hypothetical protein
MDAAGWRFYVDKLLKHEIYGLAALLLDNLDSHVRRRVSELSLRSLTPKWSLPLIRRRLVKRWT